jgi:hypothetical protein
MNSIKERITGITVIFGLIILVSVVQAQQPFQVIGCSSGAVVTLSEGQALTVYNIVGKGPAWGTAGSKNFDDLTWDFVATLRVMDGKTIGIAYYKFTDLDQDYFILEATGDAILQGGDWKFLYGVGKWKGLTGMLRGKVVLRGRPLPVEAEQYWCRIIGTLELPQ